MSQVRAAAVLTTQQIVPTATIFDRYYELNSTMRCEPPFATLTRLFRSP